MLQNIAQFPGSTSKIKTLGFYFVSGMAAHFDFGCHRILILVPQLKVGIWN